MKDQNKHSSCDRIVRNIQRVGAATFVAGILYGFVLHGPYVWWVLLR